MADDLEATGMTEPGGHEPGEPRDPMKALRAVGVARRYFIDGASKTEIAAEFDLSRFQVARLLDWARAEDLVQIRVLDPHGLEPELSDRLQNTFGLTNAVVVSGANIPNDSVHQDLARVAAEYVTTRLAPTDVVGLAWGRTIDRLVDFLADIPPVATVQIAGGMTPVEHAISGTELVRNFAAHAQGRLYPILAPLVVRDPSTASSLRKEALIASTIEMFDKLTIAIVGIGSWDPPTSLLVASLPPEGSAALRQRGAVADMCAIAFDAAGVEIEEYLKPRAMCIPSEQLRAVPEVVAVAGGAPKARAIEAALKSGIVNTLITDSEVAHHLLDDTDRPVR